MEFVSLDEFFDDVLPEVPGCPVYTVRDRLRWAAIEFCKETGVSVETTPSLDLEANEAVFELPVTSSDVRVWQLLWAKTTAGPLLPLHRAGLVDRGAEWDGLTGDYPLSYVRKSSSEIELVPVPEAALSEVLTVHCSYIPTRTATRVDAVLLDEYREAIVDGALSKLLNMSKEAWYDPSEARERRDDFGIAISGARALADKDFQTGEQQVRMNPMA